MTVTTEQELTTERPVAQRWIVQEQFLGRTVLPGISNWDIAEEIPAEHTRGHAVEGYLYLYTAPGAGSRAYTIDGKQHEGISARETYLELFDATRPLDGRAVAALIASQGYSQPVNYTKKLLARLRGVLDGTDELGDLFGYENRRSAIVAGVKAHAEAYGVNADAVFTGRLSVGGGFSWSQASTLVRGLNSISNQEFATETSRIQALTRAQGEFSGTDIKRHMSTPEVRAVVDDIAPLAPPEIPEELLAMSARELAEVLVRERQRTDDTIQTLWDQADQRGLCPDFDSIMSDCGWPPRPQRYTMIVRFQVKEKLTADWLLHNVGRNYQVDGDAIVIRTAEARYKKRMAEKPQDGVDASTILTAEELETRRREAGLRDDAEVISATVHL